MNIHEATTDDAKVMARLHAAGFDAAWSAEDLGSMLAQAGALALIAGDPPGGFILGRVTADEAEIVTLAVAPETRRAGLGAALVEALAAVAAAQGAASLFLEVAADNAAALGLYRAAGFGQVGSRRGYYARRDGPPADALVLRRALNSVKG